MVPGPGGSDDARARESRELCDEDPHPPRRRCEHCLPGCGSTSEGSRGGARGGVEPPACSKASPGDRVQLVGRRDEEVGLRLELRPPNTAAPTSIPWTSRPRACTTPAKSVPLPIGGRARPANASQAAGRSTIFQSMALSPAARMRTRTWFGAGSGSRTWRTARLPMLPRRSITTAGASGRLPHDPTPVASGRDDHVARLPVRPDGSHPAIPEGSQRDTAPPVRRSCNRMSHAVTVRNTVPAPTRRPGPRRR